MVNKSLTVLVDFLAGVAIGTVAIVVWWLGLGIVLAVAMRMASWLDFQRSPVVIVTIMAYCVLSLPACRWFERKVF